MSNLVVKKFYGEWCGPCKILAPMFEDVKKGFDNVKFENIDVDKRPFHCIDSSRSKYILRENDNWSIDDRGERVARHAYDAIRPIYDISDTTDPETKIKNVDK